MMQEGGEAHRVNTEKGDDDMASIEFIRNRISGAEKKLEKLNKKLERIRKVEAQNWEDPNPYYYSEYDLRSCLRDIEDTQKSLNGYKEQLASEEEKASSRNVPAIVSFLDGWKARVTKQYAKGLNEYYEEEKAVRELYNKIEWYYTDSPEKKAYDEANEVFNRKCYGYYEKQEFTNRWGKPDSRKVKVRDGEYEWMKPYNGESTFEEAMAKVEKDLVQEWNRKYDFIIERTNKIVGVITDASGLKVGAKGDLNGFIIGTKGTAKVQTIGAGGYNIQCFHFRTLIDEVR